MTTDQETLAKLDRALVRCRRLAEKALADSPIDGPAIVAGLMMDSLGRAEQEELWVLLCDTRNRVITRVQVYRGSLNSASVRIAEVFREAIRQNAASLVVVHNHPSGDPSPSPEDIALTRSIVQAGQLLDVNVLDHVIIGRGAYKSLRAAGLGF